MISTKNEWKVDKMKNDFDRIDAYYEKRRGMIGEFRAKIWRCRHCGEWMRGDRLYFRDENGHYHICGEPVMIIDREDM